MNLTGMACYQPAVFPSDTYPEPDTNVAALQWTANDLEQAVFLIWIKGFCFVPQYFS
jgi:hypothetical protein